jgi:hypothetical protein
VEEGEREADRWARMKMNSGIGNLKLHEFDLAQ